MTKQPFTWREFMAAMRKAGYKNIGQGCFIHRETARKYYAWNYHPEIGEAWKAWAKVRRTPPEL